MVITEVGFGPVALLRQINFSYNETPLTKKTTVVVLEHAIGL